MLGHFDVALFNFINKTLVNPILDNAVPYITELASGEFLFALAVALIIFGKRENRMCGILLLAGLTVTYHITEFAKNALSVPRPFITIPDARVLMGSSAGYSFPSGHAANAFMAAFIISKTYRRAFLPSFLIAVLVALSRVYAGAHYFSDVAAGTALGLLIGYSLFKLTDRSKAIYI